jgi:hypothetical protein
MARPRARFRLSLKDREEHGTLKIELIPAPNETAFASNPNALRYRIRVNDRISIKVKAATLTEVFDRLRRWLVARARKHRNPPGR